MRDYVIVTDSSCDLPAELSKSMGVTVVPMGMVFDGNTYKHYNDFRELSADTYFTKLRNGSTGSTSGTNIQDAIDVMRNILESDKDVMFLSLSSGLSCSYQNACLAAEEMREEFPEHRIEVVDTKSVCLGLGMLVYMAAKMKNNGASFDETFNMVESKKMKVHHHFVVDDLAALQRSGRISHLTSVVGGIIGIKPMFTIGANGKINSTGKVRGRKAAMRQIVAEAKNSATDNSIFAIAHANTEEDAAMVKAQLEEAYPGAEFIVSNIGPIIGINTGINTMAVICLGEDR